MKVSRITLLAVLATALNLSSSVLAMDGEYAQDDMYESHDHYVPVATPVVEGTGEVVYGTGRVAKGAVVGTGEILTGDPVGGAETVATDTLGGTADAVKGALAVPGNILFGR